MSKQLSSNGVKKFILTGLAVLTFVFSCSTYAQDNVDTRLNKPQENFNIYFFWGEGCPHCAKEKDFLEKLAQEYPKINIYEYEVWYSRVNQQKLVYAGKTLNTDISGVPFLVIGTDYVVGFGDETTTGQIIRDKISMCMQNSCPDIFSTDYKPELIGPLIDENPSEENPGIIPETDSNSKTDPENPGPAFIPPTTAQTLNLKDIQLPKIANIDLTGLSLPALTAILGFLDGFNPCAMWTLLFLISLLIGMENKKRMWLLGIAFIVSSASVYFLFMVAWLNILLFIGFILWVRLLIGLVAFLGGLVNLKKFFFEKESGCDVSNSEEKKKVFDKLGKITTNKSFILALLGIIGLAFAVNLVELICSAGLPAVYTQILTLNHLTGIQYYLYILMYILFFMLDDLFVFVVAMLTLELTGITTKYVRFTRLIGGLMMLAIGLLLLFKPELLMFG